MRINLKIVRIERDIGEKFGTFGVLLPSWDNDVKFVTLECPWRDNARNISCIPPGRYEVKFRYSNKFCKNMPFIQAVPGRSGIMIHPLNYVHETTGCIGVGSGFIGNWHGISGSRNAFNWLMNGLDGFDFDLIVIDPRFAKHWSITNEISSKSGG